jgi:hypothetical protein
MKLFVFSIGLFFVSVAHSQYHPHPQVHLGLGLYSKHFNASSYKDERYQNGKPSAYNEGSWRNNRIMGILLRHQGHEAGLIMHNNSYENPTWGALYNRLHPLQYEFSVNYGLTLSYGYEKPVKKEGKVVAYKTTFTAAPQVGVRYQWFSRSQLAADMIGYDVIVLSLLLQFE